MKSRRKTKPPIFDKDGYQTNLKDLNGTLLPDLRKVQAVSFWGDAALRRLKEIEEGRVKMIPGQVVAAKMRKILGRG